MNGLEWIEDFNAAITVCDKEGIVLSMNQASARTFTNDGGRGLIGKNIFDCHPGPAQKKLRDLMDAEKTNCYTIEKKGVKKMIYQAPWYQEGEYKGFVEIVFPLPEGEMPHFIRK